MAEIYSTIKDLQEKDPILYRLKIKKSKIIINMKKYFKIWKFVYDKMQALIRTSQKLET